MYVVIHSQRFSENVLGNAQPNRETWQAAFPFFFLVSHFWLSKHSGKRQMAKRVWGGGEANVKLKNGKMTFVYATHASCNRYPFYHPPLSPP